MGNSGSSPAPDTTVYPVKGNCSASAPGSSVKVYQHCKGGHTGWTAQFCAGKFQTANNDFPGDASHIKVPTGFRATIYQGIFTGRSRVIEQNQEYDFCDEGRWANDTIRSILVEALPQISQNSLDAYNQRFNAQVGDYNNVLAQVQLLGDTGRGNIAGKYKQSLIQKYSDLHEKTKTYKEEYISDRRRFLDANPHESVKGLGPFKTLDDRLILLFWICYLIFIIPSVIFMGNRLGFPFFDKNNVTVLMAVMLILVLSGHFTIRYML